MNNVLIIKPSSFGDIIQALPVAARIREAAPDARICWLVNSRYGRLLGNNPCIDRVFLFPRRLWKEWRTRPAAAASFAALCRDLRRERFDAVLDLQGLFRSGLFAAVTGARFRAGFANAREAAPFFYSLRVPVPEGGLHSTDRYLLLADAAGFRGDTVAFPLGTGSGEREWAGRLLSPAGGPPRHPLVGLSASGRWTTKRWPPGNFAALGRALAADGATVVVIGGPGGEGSDVAALLGDRAVAALDIEDPLKMAALLERLDLLVTNDSGPMHLAAAVGTPVVGLFGPTDHRLTGPYGSRHAIIAAGLDCRPCFSRRCDRGMECMSRISVERVHNAVNNILKSATERYYG